MRSKRLYWHHVIQVQHGGSNSVRNFVHLCHGCHREVHPWLPAPTSLENIWGPADVRDMTAVMLEILAEMYPALPAMVAALKADRAAGRRGPAIE